MSLKQVVRSTGFGIIRLVVIALYIHNVKIWADNNGFAKTGIHEILHVYAMYDIPIINNKIFYKLWGRCVFSCRGQLPEVTE